MPTVDVPEELAPLLELADAKLFHGLQVGLWVDRGPTMEECIALSSISQDELGHARALYDLVTANGGPDMFTLQYDRPSRDFAPPAPFAVHLRDWPDVVLAIAVNDRLLGHAVRADERTEGLRAKLRQEETWHLRHGDAWLATLAGNASARDDLEAALDRLWPAVAHWLHRFPGDARADAVRDVVTALDAHGLSVPAAPKDGGWIVEPPAGDELDARVAELTEDARVEIAAMLQDPEARTMAEAFLSGDE